MSRSTVRYTAEPTPVRFHHSAAFVRGLMGPIGSGKSVACCMEVLRRALEQEPGPDGVRRTRWAFIRETYPELKSTTIKTWLDWVPEERYGNVKWEAPIKHVVKLTKRCELEVLFLALDRPQDTKKLLSLELTGAWINEAREVPKAVVDAATGRVGRYPGPQHGGCTWSGVIMDTNPPDDDHWWYELAEEERPENWAFFRQPAGDSADAEALNWLMQTKDTLALPYNHPQRIERGRMYYQRIRTGKDDSWVKVYVRGEYGTVEEGKPVYRGAWSDSLHVASDELWPLPKLPVVIGFDFGLTPAAVFCQITPRGHLRILDELVAEDMGLRQFCENVVLPLIEEKYTKTPLYITGDPSGPRDYSENSAYDILEEVLGDKAEEIEPAPTNEPAPRIEAVKWFLTRLTDGVPTLQLSPTCKILRKGFNGGYKFRRLQVAGEERFTQKPDKNSFSHPHDAMQYAALKLKGGTLKSKRPPLSQAHSGPADVVAGY